MMEYKENTHCPKILVLCEIEMKVLHKFKKETKTVKGRPNIEMLNTENIDDAYNYDS